MTVGRLEVFTGTEVVDLCVSVAFLDAGMHEDDVDCMWLRVDVRTLRWPIHGPTSVGELLGIEVFEP